MIGEAPRRGEDQTRRRISLELDPELVQLVDHLKTEWGLRSRGEILDRLLRQLLAGDQVVDQPAAPEVDSQAVPLDENRALVLREPEWPEDPGFDFEEPPGSREKSRRSSGIDLPGFVRRNTEQLRRSLHPPATAGQESPSMALVGREQLLLALDTAHLHWKDLYGQPANEAVRDAAMQWLGLEIWPQCDQSEGRPFTWTLLQRVLQDLAPGWEDGATSFERIIVAAGILEDPYAASSLSLRIPTLIRRFVQRCRQRRRGASFDALQNTMTLHGALRLLNLPTTAGQRLTLAQIREAYKQQALNHHPDAGGSTETMRRLNEAYQLLKDKLQSPH